MKLLKRDYGALPGSLTAFVDFQMNLLIGILMLFFIAMSLMIAQLKKEGIEQKAEYIISAEWPTNVSADVDLWVATPREKVGWLNRQSLNMHLDVDNRGYIDSRNSDGTIMKSIKEIITVRNRFAADFTVNVHLYNIMVNGKALSRGQESGVDLPVKIEVIKLNPSLQIVYSSTLIFTKHWQELNALNFTIDKDGNFGNVRHEFKTLLSTGVTNPGSRSPTINSNPGVIP